MRKFKFNTDEPIEIELYKNGFQYAKYKARLKAIKVKRGEYDQIIFEEVPPIVKVEFMNNDETDPLEIETALGDKFIIPITDK